MSEVQHQSKGIFKELIRHPLGLTGIIWIAICVLIAVSGYGFVQDDSPLANRVNLHAAFLKPGSKTQFFIPKSESQVTFVKKIFLGNPETSNAVVFNRMEQSQDSFHLYFDIPDEYSVLVLEGVLPFLHESKIKNSTFWLGTDNLGRDVLSRLLLGTRISLAVGLIAVLISLIIGVSLGLTAGYYGGAVDKAIMWLASVLWSLPTLLLVLAISFALGKGFWQIFVAIGLGSWVELTRVIRGEVMSLKEKEFVKAAKLLGVSDFKVLFRHILPNVSGSVIVICTANFASAILLEAGLSFLGLGVKPPTPSWGIMINEYFGYILLNKAYLALVPGFAIMFLVVSFNFLGIALRDVLNRS
jgi:oligopeptide transport system permease protein